MCGIIGACGKVNFKEYLTAQLRKLDYRGYDSAGIGYFAYDKVEVKKVFGRVSSLESLLPPNIDSRVGIGHTRWATHGRPNAINAHPQCSNDGKIALVHNGVISNYKTLQNQLKVRNYRFFSETDTEVIVNLLDWYYRRSGSFIEALAEASENLEGTYACTIIAEDEPNRLFFLKKGSPLLICKGEEATYISSDPISFEKETGPVYELEDGSYGYLSDKEISVYQKGELVGLKQITLPSSSFDLELNGYSYYMEKEIHQIPQCLDNLVSNYFGEGKLNFESSLLETIGKAKEVEILGCGSSYFAASSASFCFRKNGKKCRAQIASEWDEDQLRQEDAFYILLSQSGETADLIRCQNILNQRAIPHLVITNKKGSTLERKATYCLLLYAGDEVAVASTKTFACEVGLLYLLSSQGRAMDELSSSFKQLGECIEDILARKKEIQNLSAKLSGSLYVLGKGESYPSSQEVALKFKEVSYIHAEAFPSGEFKHGPIALIENDFPALVLISSSKNNASLRLDAEGIKSRQGNPIIICNGPFALDGDDFAFKEIEPELSAIAFGCIGALLSFFYALNKGYSIDRPRNLAKSVTV